MAKHEFGIMPSNPGKERYDNYEPDQYSLLVIDDEHLERLLKKFDKIPCYWHSLCRLEKNLAYFGITLIPPESASSFIRVFKRHDQGQYGSLISLFEQAVSDNKYIIHYGI